MDMQAKLNDLKRNIDEFKERVSSIMRGRSPMSMTAQEARETKRTIKNEMNLISGGER